MKKIIFSIVCLLLLNCVVCFAETDGFSETEQVLLDYLSSELEKSTNQWEWDDDIPTGIYSTLSWKSVADIFPAKFDLRDRGTVTSVKNQRPWGTCWSFATIGASETSILNSLGLTTEEYLEKYGEELDLSEKHLAWFAMEHLPELDAYPEGEYPFDESQAGEGLHLVVGTTTNTFNLGGYYSQSAATLASGIGILKEKFAPYTNSDGGLSVNGDWSLPEEQRFEVSFELKNANLLPDPARIDEDGNYYYQEAATEAVKSELMAGRAVAIDFLADRALPDLSKEDLRAYLLQFYAGRIDFEDPEGQRYIDLFVGDLDPKDVSVEELKDLIQLRLRIEQVNENPYDLDSFDHDQLAKILLSNSFPKSYEVIVEDEEHPKTHMSFIGDDPVIYAHYTNEPLPVNHGVTVVGWDDTFSAENWPEDRRPPADGVWIAKNSWSEEWGNDGYFLISYYDQSLRNFGSFEYVVDDNLQMMDHLSILQYDYMPNAITWSTLFDSPVYEANVFDVDEDSVLQYVSTMTGDLNTTVTAFIYLLDEDAVLPTDGRLLDSKTETFLFAGYHRMELNGNILLPEGSRISVVILEHVPVEAGAQYALLSNSGVSEAGAEVYNRIHKDDGHSLDRYAKGVVNPGESFISLEPDRWIDWVDAIAVISENGVNANMSYDNLPIKAYVYPWSQIELIHDLSHRIPVAGGEAAICPEDGYMLLDIAR